MRKLYLKNKLLIALSKPFENRRLFTPLQLNIYTLKDHGLWPEKLIALDAFCQTGLQWTRIFYDQADYIEMWDIDPLAIKYAKKEFPKAEVICGDSINAIKTKGFKRSDFNFAIIDTPIPFRYGDGKFEHFDFFKDIFKSMANTCVVVFDVIPDITKILSRHPHSKEFVQEWTNARKNFYGGVTAEKISPNTMTAVYEEIVKQLGYKVQYINYNARNEFFGFITIAATK